MKVVTVQLHVVVPDEALATNVVQEMLARHMQSRVSVLVERTLENGMDPRIELDVDAFLYEVNNSKWVGDVAVHRQVLTDLNQPDENRSRRRWARIKELDKLWKDGWEPQLGGKKLPKGQASFHETDEGVAVAAEKSWLHALERETACLLEWPVWQERQHTEVLIDGVLWNAEVMAFDIQRRTVEVGVWSEDDAMGSVRLKTDFRTVTVEQIEAGIAEEERREEARRQAHRDRDAVSEATRVAKKQKQKVRKTPPPAAPADLFSSIPTVE